MTQQRLKHVLKMPKTQLESAEKHVEAKVVEKMLWLMLPIPKLRKPRHVENQTSGERGCVGKEANIEKKNKPKEQTSGIIGPGP